MHKNMILILKQFVDIRDQCLDKMNTYINTYFYCNWLIKPHNSLNRGLENLIINAFTSFYVCTRCIKIIKVSLKLSVDRTCSHFI